MNLTHRNLHTRIQCTVKERYLTLGAPLQAMKAGFIHNDFILQGLDYRLELIQFYLKRPTRLQNKFGRWHLT